MSALIKQLSAVLLLLLLILAAEYYFNFDIIIQNRLYNYEHRQWLISPEFHKQLAPFFYNGPKIITGIVGMSLLGILLASIRFPQLRKYNKPALILLLSLILVPVVVAGAKYFTNVYCPYQLDIYSGRFPFVRILANYPADFSQLKPGRCFPAGHATVGFAYMALFYCFNTPWKRWAGLSLGLTLGIIASAYQMFRGQHFLSHSLFSMVASFMIIIIINFCVSKIMNTKKI